MKALLGRLAVLGLGVALLVSSGCGAATGDVSGVVKYKGKALEGGQISFKGGKGKLVGADINPDGTFSAAGVPVGTVQVGVSYIDPKVVDYFKELSQQGRGEKKGPGPKGDPSQFSKVPDKYGDPNGSGLTIEVKGGKNDGVTIELKD